MWDKEILEQCGCWFTDTGECVKDDLDLNKFARVIIEKEREACANLRKEVALLGKRSTEYEEGFWEGLSKYEDLIRARGQA